MATSGIPAVFALSLHPPSRYAREGVYQPDEVISYKGGDIRRLSRLRSYSRLRGR